MFIHSYLPDHFFVLYYMYINFFSNLWTLFVCDFLTLNVQRKTVLGGEKEYTLWWYSIRYDSNSIRITNSWNRQCPKCHFFHTKFSSAGLKLTYLKINLITLFYERVSSESTKLSIKKLELKNLSVKLFNKVWLPRQYRYFRSTEYRRALLR